MKLNLELPYEIQPEDRALTNPTQPGWTPWTPVSISCRLIRLALGSKAGPKGGIESPVERRIHGKIQNGMSAARTKGENVLEISEEGFKTLMDAVKDFAAPTDICGWYVTFFDHLEEVEAKLRADKKAATEEKK